VRRRKERKVGQKNGTARDKVRIQEEVGKKNFQNEEKREGTKGECLDESWQKKKMGKENKDGEINIT
jgi:hypothetical protein